MKFIYIDSNYIVYASEIDPDICNDLFITEHDLDPVELEDLLNVLQDTIDAVLMQLGRDTNKVKIKIDNSLN